MENFTSAIDRVLGLCDLHSSLTTKPGRPKQDKSDLLRGAIVLSAAALDEVVLESVIAALPSAAKKGLLANSNVLNWIKRKPEALIAALSKPSPENVLIELARAEIGTMTFQKSSAIGGLLEDALGANPPWERTAAELNRHGGGRVWTAEAVATALDQFILRRNRIAHSGDRNERGGLSGIRRPYVLDNTTLVLNVGLAVLYEVDQRIG